jgi:hypothetical protein
VHYLEGDNILKPKELYATPMEDEFNNWLEKFVSLKALFSSRHHLPAKLTNANLRAGSIVLMGAVIAKDSDVFISPVVRHPKSEDKDEAFCIAQHFNQFERAL